MSEPITPLPPNARRLLEAVLPPRPPPGAAERVFSRLQKSIHSPPPPPTPAPASGFKLGVSALLAGLVAGAILTRTLFPPLSLPPVVIPVAIERVRVVEKEVPVVVQATPTPARSAPASTPPKPVVAEVDANLAREREFVDTARSALMRGNAAGALAAVRAHESEFNAGRLAEERESLWVQTLVFDGQLDAAKARARRFHELFPRSLLGATVDAALAEP